MLLTYIPGKGRFNLNTRVRDKKSAQTSCHLTPELVREHELQLKDTVQKKEKLFKYDKNKNSTSYLPGSKDMENSEIK